MPTPARTIALTLLAALAGCSGDAPPPEAGAGAAPVANPSMASEYTAAVPLGAIAASARLHFQLDSRPVVGKPVTVRFRVVPTAAVQKIQIVFEPEPGMRIVDELRATVFVDGPATTAAAPHELQVVASASGVLLLKANVMTESDHRSVSTEFAIPLLVANAAP